MDQNISLVYRAKSCVERLKNRLSLISQHGMIHRITITIDVNPVRTKYVANIFSDSFLFQSMQYNKIQCALRK